MADNIAETFPIVRVKGRVDLWFKWEITHTYSGGDGGGNCTFRLGGRGRRFATESKKEVVLLQLVRDIYDKKIGHIASRWSNIDDIGSGLKDQLPIEYEHAKVKLGNVFDYYTTCDGVLQVPEWIHFKYAVEEYLENDPRVKYHPSRVRQFIEERDVEQLEDIE